MSPLFLILFIAGFVTVESFVNKPKLPSRSFSAMSSISDVLADKNEMIELCRSVKVGEPVSDDLALKIKECFERMASLSTQAGILEYLPNMEGKWIMLYGTAPRYYRRTSLTELSAKTIDSPEPLIVVSSVIQSVTQKSPGVYTYDNIALFQAGKEGEATINGKLQTRGFATLNYPGSADNTLRMEVEFYENDAQAALPTTEDSNEFNRLFGFPVGKTISAPFPPNFAAWNDIVFLDDDLRLMRGTGYIFVLMKVA